MVCPMCEKPAIDGKAHPRCRTPQCLDGLVSFFRYSGLIRKAVKTMKYRLVTDMVSEFVALVPMTSYNYLIKSIPVDETVLLPIPLHPTRFRERGFN
jgi:predicted amidophosphoribosyltransferase